MEGAEQSKLTAVLAVGILWPACGRLAVVAVVAQQYRMRQLCRATQRTAHSDEAGTSFRHELPLFTVARTGPSPHVTRRSIV